MDWIEGFYSATRDWWAAAEAVVDEVDRQRAALLTTLAPSASTVLDLGCGYGTSAHAIAATGRSVVGVDLSSRIHHAPDISSAIGDVELLPDDFFEIDVVCCWDGVGNDDDQRRLLVRIADDWLIDGGVSLLEVFHPSGWVLDDGLSETKPADPAQGDPHTLGHRRAFDPETTTATDSWWVIDPDITDPVVLTQHLRCYAPHELAELAAASGLDVTAVLAPDREHAIDADLLLPTWSYLAVLHHR